MPSGDWNKRRWRAVTVKLGGFDGDLFEGFRITDLELHSINYARNNNDRWSYCEDVSSHLGEGFQIANMWLQGPFHF